MVNPGKSARCAAQRPQTEKWGAVESCDKAQNNWHFWTPVLSPVHGTRRPSAARYGWPQGPGKFRCAAMRWNMPCAP